MVEHREEVMPKLSLLMPFAKKLQGIDYEHALKAMIKDAEVPPADAEKEGRGVLLNTIL